MLLIDWTLGLYGDNHRTKCYGMYSYGDTPDYTNDPPDNTGDFKPIYNNTNPDYYYDVGYENHKIYNSAILHNSSGIYLCIIVDRAFSGYQRIDGNTTRYGFIEYDSRYTRNGIYTEGNANGAFEGSWNTFVYSAGCGWKTNQYSVLEFHDSELPTFTDAQEYMNYITNPCDPGVKVKVNYMIPEGDYSYCKLTYKPDYQPENQNDGTSIDISPSGSSVNVEGLDENQLYYFTLFTDKSESEPFPFTVGEMDHYPVPTEFKTEYDNIFIMPLSNISQPPGGGGWSYGYQQFIDDYLPNYKDYSYIGYNASPYILDVASATTNKEANMKMSSTKVDMLITPNKELKFRNHTADVILDGWCNQLRYRYLASYDCRLVGPYTNDSTDRWADRSFSSDEDLWTFISRNVRFVNVYYGTNWDNALIMR